MINFKKGNGHSLHQTDKTGKAKANEAVIAGMFVNIDTSGDVVKGGAATGVLGFAVNNQTDGDVIESGKIGVVLLDGNTVLETDQVKIVTGSTINATDYPVGTALTYGTVGGDIGKVRAQTGVERIIGYVEGIRDFPWTESVSQNYKNVAGTTLTNTVTTQKFIKVLGIKLAV